MKIGSAVAFLVLALITLGYLLSDNINKREELNMMRKQNQKISLELLAVQAEKDAAKESLAQNEGKINDLSLQSSVQQKQIQSLIDENINLKKQNVLLEGQVSVLKYFNTFQSSFPRSLGLVFFLPIIPASMAATYLIVNYKKKQPLKNTNQESQRRTLVQLTDKEIKEIIHIRRVK